MIQRRQFEVVKDDPALLGLVLQNLKSVENGEVSIAVRNSRVVQIVTSRRPAVQISRAQTSAAHPTKTAE